jgi:shikimate dehydrogenase
MSADAGRSRRKCAVLGSPIAHSLSPVLHRAAYRELGLDWDYSAHDVTRSTLREFWGSLTPTWRGLSLTMPLKREVIALCDRVESLGAMLSSVNTVVFDDTGSARGYNTDVVGVVRALKQMAVHRLDSAVVVGGGATAASALAAVAQLGATRVSVLVRAPERAAQLGQLGPALALDVDVVGFSAVEEIAPADVVISTIPETAQSAIAEPMCALAPVVFDVIYDPAETTLLKAARSAGRVVVPGFELLLHQAARQVELMTGARTAPIDEMRTAGLAALGNR